MPGMTKRLSRQGVILTASIAAIAPSPLNVVYHATKVLIHDVSIALEEELRERNCDVDFMVLCPGLCRTNLNDGLFKKFYIGNVLGIARDPKEVVACALRDFGYEKMTHGPISYDITAALYHIL